MDGRQTRWRPPRTRSRSGTVGSGSALLSASPFRSRWTPGRIALARAALLAYHLTYFTYHNLKSCYAGVVVMPNSACSNAVGGVGWSA